MNAVTYLSPALTVHMSDAWFEIATLDHFWIKRRFEVFQTLWNSEKIEASVAEIGCGHGLVLQQINKAFKVRADGYDLNELALEKADAECGRLFCYNIHDRQASLKQKYDAIFLFDVIEHLEDDKGFTESVLFHLKPGGHLVINVPAFQSLFSKYDKVVGHQRRYDIGMLTALANTLSLSVEAWSYWGLPYIPILRVRQQMIKNVSDEEVTRRGFAPPSSLFNSLLLALGRMEFIPNHRLGTSLMAVLQAPN